MKTFRQYTHTPTNLSFEEIFAGEYAIDLIKPPSVVLDIGANEGAFSAWAIEKWPDCSIFAFEPMPFNAELFRKNHGNNPRICFTEAAISESLTLEMYLGEHNSGECSRYDNGEQLPTKFTVSCDPPKALPKADLVKIDTEGCELEILRGMDLSATKAVLVEYHSPQDGHDIMVLLANQGFELVEQNPITQRQGVLKYARPGTVKHMPSDVAKSVIPDRTILSGTMPGGTLVSATAESIRNEHYDSRLTGKKLFIGLPIYSSPMTQFVKSLLELQAFKPLPMEIRISQGDGVARSRNVLTAAFLKSDCTHMMLIDSDLIFNRKHIIDLLLADQPIVGGFYPKKQQGPLEWVVNALTPSPRVRPDGLQPIKYVGTGFMCIKREVFEKMMEFYPEIKFREDYGDRELAHDFWSMGVYRDADGMAVESAQKLLRYCKANPSPVLESMLQVLIDSKPNNESRYLSEDWFFCQRWLDMGGECFVHSRVALRHIGPVIFPLDTQLPEVAHPQVRVPNPKTPRGQTLEIEPPLEQDLKTRNSVYSQVAS